MFSFHQKLYLPTKTNKRGVSGGKQRSGHMLFWTDCSIGRSLCRSVYPLITFYIAMGILLNCQKYWGRLIHLSQHTSPRLSLLKSSTPSCIKLNCSSVVRPGSIEKQCIKYSNSSPNGMFPALSPRIRCPDNGFLVLNQKQPGHWSNRTSRHCWRTLCSLIWSSWDRNNSCGLVTQSNLFVFPSVSAPSRWLYPNNPLDEYESFVMYVLPHLSKCNC